MYLVIKSIFVMWIIVIGLTGCGSGGIDPHLDTLSEITETLSNYRTDIRETSSLNTAQERYRAYDKEVRGLVDKLRDRKGKMHCDSQEMSGMINRMHGELDGHGEIVTDSSTLEEVQEECERHAEEMDHHVGECEGMHGGMMHHGMGG